MVNTLENTLEKPMSKNIAIEKLPDEGVTIRANVPSELWLDIQSRFRKNIRYGEITLLDVYGYLIRVALELNRTEFEYYAKSLPEIEVSEDTKGTHFFMPTDISEGLDDIRERELMLKRDAFVLCLRVGLLSLESDN